jgi:hypothetical protein
VSTPGRPPGRPSGRPRRPTLLGPVALDARQGGTDPALRIDAAHTTAAALVAHGRGSDDPSVTARLVAITDEHGIDEVAELWSDRPAGTLPGALWRLYAVRAGIREQPESYARAFELGRRRAPVDEVLAGVASPPTAEDVVVLADAVLTGAFDGDLAIALERAAAFCRIVATGWAVRADDLAESDDEPLAARLTQTAAGLAKVAAELDDAARLWRDERLS